LGKAIHHVADAHHGKAIHNVPDAQHWDVPDAQHQWVEINALASRERYHPATYIWSPDECHIILVEA
jgi:hypothetical protein